MRVPCPLRCPCEAKHFQRVFEYSEPPPGEIGFSFSQRGGEYRREVHSCRLCGHYVSVHEMASDLEALYAGDYVSATYKDEAGLLAAFERIIGLPREKSDNEGRVLRVCAFAARRFAASQDPSRWMLLDIGSGLGVFVHAMKREGWRCVAVDPDARAALHVARRVGVECIASDYMKADGLGRFDAVSLTKVLEHVADPVGMLERTAENLRGDGFVYVEVPDGETAERAGKERQEFGLAHVNVFSASSLALAVTRAGYRIEDLERVVEPSGKYTLLAFAVPKIERGTPR